MSTYIPCGLLLALLTLPLRGQQFLNTSFEHNSPAGYPLVWEVNEGTGSGTVRVDSSVAYRGRKSLRLTASDSPMLLAGLRFPVGRVRGKTICISGYIRTDSLRGGVAQWMYYDYGRRALLADTQAVSGTTPWQAYSYTFSIDSAARGEGIVVGIRAGGTGVVHLDGVTLSVDGQPLADQPYHPAERSAAQTGWLHRQAIPVPSGPETGDKPGWKRFRQMVGPARIVALGENSHGSGTTFRVKHQLLKYLVEEMGFTVLALEAPAPEADRINDYVQGGAATRAELMQYLGFKSWQTEEMLAVLEWMREYNRTHQRRVRFAGFDIQSRGVALENLSHFARQHDPFMARQVDSMAALLAKSALSDSLRNVAYGMSEALLARLTNRSAGPYAGVDAQTRSRLERDAIILQQHIGLPLLRNRRECMAANITWLEEHAPAGSKLVVWAGNGHVSREGVSMGNYLSRRYGDAYLAVGFTFHAGTYAAYGPRNYYPAEPSYPGTYEHYLNRAKYRQYALDLRPAHPVGEWLRRPLALRDLGPEPQNNQFRQINLTEHFDVLIFLKESAHAVYLQP